MGLDSMSFRQAFRNFITTTKCEPVLAFLFQSVDQEKKRNNMFPFEQSSQEHNCLQALQLDKLLILTVLQCVLQACGPERSNVIYIERAIS